jgi:hypothetical protein
MRIILAILSVLLNSAFLNAQNHYWAQQYGAENTLLGGAVVGGVSDNSAMYYNPARLGFIESPKISLSANTYGVEIVNLKNAAGTNLDLKSAKLVLFPQIAAGSLVIKKNRKFKMVYGSLIRHRTALHYEQTNSMSYDLFKQFPGNEFYDARVEFDYNSTANWFGGAFAYRINKNWSIGYSQFFTYINLQYRQTYNITSDNFVNDIYFVSAHNSNLNFIINNVGAVEKLGIAYEKQSKRKDSLFFKLGCNITMPSFKIFSKSKVYHSTEFNNIIQEDFSVIDSFRNLTVVLNNANSNIKSQFKDPASIALGFEIENKKFRFCTTIEYFFKIKEYNMIKDNSKTYIRPVKNNNPDYLTDYMTVKQNNQPIVNAAVGFEYKFKTKVKKENKTITWSLLFGIRTDFNNHDQVYRLQKKDKVTDDVFNPDSWRYLHYSFGASIDRRTDKFSFGIDYGKGLTNRTQQAINITEPTSDDYMLGVKQNTVIPKINSINFIMGYSYKFIKTAQVMNIRPF